MQSTIKIEFLHFKLAHNMLHYIIQNNLKGRKIRLRAFYNFKKFYVRKWHEKIVPILVNNKQKLVKEGIFLILVKDFDRFHSISKLNLKKNFL